MDGISIGAIKDVLLNIDWEVVYAIVGAVGAAGFSKIRETVKKNKLVSLVTHRSYGTKQPIVAMSVSSHECDVIGKKRDMLVLDEARPFFRVMDLLRSKSIRVHVIETDRSTDMDEIHVSGPVANIHTNRVFCQYLRNIYWCVNESHLKQYQADSRLSKFNYDYIQVSEEYEGFVIDGELYRYVKGQVGWAIIARINATRDICPKKIHLLFGCGTNGTIGAVNYFTQNYERLAKIFGKRTNYIGIFKVDRDGNMLGPIKWLDADKFIAD